MMCMGHLSGAAGPHFHCHNMCTMWIINQVLSLKVLSYYRLCMLSSSCLLVSSMCLLACPLPLCIHGNSCPLGQLPASEQCLNRHVSDHNHCEAHTPISVLCVPIRVKGSIWSVSIFCRDIVLVGRSTMWTLWCFLKNPAVVGPNWVHDVRDTNANIWCDSFSQFILNGLAPFRYFTA